MFSPFNVTYVKFYRCHDDIYAQDKAKSIILITTTLFSVSMFPKAWLKETQVSGPIFSPGILCFYNVSVRMDGIWEEIDNLIFSLQARGSCEI